MRLVSTAPQAILVSGVYGVGKSTVIAQIADLLDGHDVHYAALDLDWLGWAWSEPADDPETPQNAGAVDELMLENLALLVSNLRRRGNDRFLLAGSVMTGAALQAVEATMAMPIRLVRLTASLETIQRRLSNEPTTGRLDDLRQTEAWLADESGDEPAADLVIANDGPIVETARAILNWSGWLDPTLGAR